MTVMDDDVDLDLFDGRWEVGAFDSEMVFDLGALDYEFDEREVGAGDAFWVYDEVLGERIGDAEEEGFESFGDFCFVASEVEACDGKIHVAAFYG